MATQGIICQGCGIEAPSKYVEFHQNIGALLIRFHRSTRGNLCKKCVHVHFWKRTMVTVAIGWCGTISLILAPIFVVNNLVRYLAALGMPAVPAGATRPQLTEQAIAALYPHANALADRLNAGEDIVAVSQDIAPAAGVTPGQVLLYVHALAQASRPAEKTYGFPVQPAAAPSPLPVIPLESEPSPRPSPESEIS